MIQISEEASVQLHGERQRSGLPYLRLGVARGCRGITFSLSPEGERRADDLSVEVGALKFLVEERERPFLDGLVVELYEGELLAFNPDYGGLGAC